MVESKGELLEIYALGGLRITQGGAPVAGLTSSKAEALLVYLAATGRTYSRESLAELLWENRPQRRSLSNLRVVLTSIREHLFPYVEITRQTVAMSPQGAFWMDAAELERHLSEARDEFHRAGRMSQATAARLTQAVELYQGGFLDGFFVRESSSFEDWSSTERQRFERVAVEALDRLVGYYLEIGEYVAALELGRRLLELDSLREETYRKLMLLSAYRGERIVALDYYQACRRVLAEELGIQPEKVTTELFEQIAAGTIGTMRPLFSAGHLQAQSTDLVGREEELADIARLLRSPSCRLLTLSGPGGIGKTRLAREVAEQIEDAFDGVHFVSLSPVHSDEELLSAIADGIGFAFQGQGDAESQLLAHLEQRRVLLVLDGCEHLLGDVIDLLMGMLGRATALKVLVTSRERLNLQEEWLRPLAPLSVPPEADAADAESHSAVRLFLQHASRVRANLELTPGNRRWIGIICCQVGGNPLGIELAAAWTRMLACKEIAREIQQTLDFLVSSHRDSDERHQSLRAVFEHSWRLLTGEERTVFKRLSIFSGGFRRDAVASVAGGSFPVLSALIDKSLIRSNLRGRYEMHELLQQYAAEKLGESPDEMARIKKLHARYYAGFLEEREADLVGRARNEVVDLIKEEIGNIRAAWHWAISESGEPEVGQMLKGLWFFYEAQDQYEEARAAFSRAAERLLAEVSWEDGSNVAGQVLACQGWFLYRGGLIREGKRLLEKSVQIARQHAGWPEIAFSLTLLGLVSNARGEYNLARESCQESLAISEEIGDLWLQSVSLNVLGNVARNLGEHEEARELCRESLAISRETGDQLGMAISLNDLGQLAFRLGEYEQTRQLCRESLELSTAIGNQLGIAIAVDRLGKAAQALGEYEEASRLCRESLERSRAIGDTLGIAISLNYLSSVACAQGDHATARAHSEEALATCREINNRRGMAFSLNQLAAVACLEERYDEAHALFQESLLLARETGNLRVVASAYNGLSDVAWQRGLVEDCWEYSLKALEAVQSANVVYLMLDTLVRVAHLLAHHGMTDRALDLAEVVRQHPAAWRETLNKVTPLHSELVSQAPAQVAEAALRAGQTAQLDETAAGLGTLLEGLQDQ